MMKGTTMEGLMRRLGWLFVAATVCVGVVPDDPVSAEEPAAGRPVPISIGPGQTLVFHRVSPAAEQLDYPDFYVQETEVTNAQFKAFLDATRRTKDDADVLRIVREREPKVVPSADGKS